MLSYAFFDLYPTVWSLLMEDFALVASGVVGVLLLSVLAAWLVMIVLLIILLPTYLLGVLHPAIQKIALRLQQEVLKENKVLVPAAVRFADREWSLLFATSYRVKLKLRSVLAWLANHNYTSKFLRHPLTSLPEIPIPQKYRDSMCV